MSRCDPFGHEGLEYDPFLLAPILSLEEREPRCPRCCKARALDLQ